MNDEISGISNRLDTVEQRLEALESIVKSGSSSKRTKPKSIKEFYLEVGPKSGVNKTLVIAYYLEIYKDYKSFTVKEIEKGFKEAREKAPDNTSLSVYMNADKGYFVEVERKNGNKAYELTKTGIKFVEDGLKKNE